MSTRVRALHPQDKVEDYLARGWFSGETVDEVFAARVADNPDRLALVDPANKAALVGAAPRRLTWADLDSESDALAAQFLRHGLTRGDILAVQMPNSVEMVTVFLAAWKVGIVVTPLAVQYREHELGIVGRQAEPTAYLTSGRVGEHDLLTPALTVCRELASVRTLLRYLPPDVSAEPVEGVSTLVAGPASATDRSELAAYRDQRGPLDPNDAMTICWTSGTEAEPKGVPRTHLEWLAAAWAGVDAPGIVADDVILNPFPMINMAAFVGLLLPWLRTGCVLVQHHPFDLPTFLGQIASERVTYTVAPPALLMMLLHNEALLASCDLSSVTRLGSGSAPLQPSMVAGWQEKHGIGVINFFGSNEGIALLSSPADFPDPVERAQFFPNYACPGYQWASRISRWVQVRLVDPITEEVITEPGVPGELRIDGPTVFPGYVRPDLHPMPFDGDGFLKSGDLFEIAGAQGQFLRFVDRARDLIIRGGVNISPAEVEGLIAAHPSVAEVAVVGDPDEVFGERVAAFVAVKPGTSLTLADLADFLRGRHVAPYKIPERLEVVDALPRNPVGKVLKRALR